MKTRIPLFSAIGLALVTVVMIVAQEPAPAPAAPPLKTVLFSNVRIYDGVSAKLSEPRNVLIRGNKIEKISSDPIPTDRSGNTVIIDGTGKTLRCPG